MNFIDAALEVLSHAPGTNIQVDEILRLAMDRELLGRPGTTPLRSLKAALTRELKKDADSRVDKVDKDLWALRNGAAAPVQEGPEAAVEEAPAAPEEAPEAAVEEAPAAPEEAPEAEAEKAPGEGEAKSGRRRRRRRRRPGGKDKPAQEIPEVVREPLEVPEPLGTVETLIAPDQPVVRGDEAEEPAEDEAADVYAGELEAKEEGAFAEFSDEQTADEDRPLLPEISARKERYAELRDRRQTEREQRKKEREERKKARAAKREARAAAEAAAVPAAAVAVLDESPRYLRPGNEVGDAAVDTLRSIKGTQPVQVKQLAQMMRKRKQLDGEPNQVWPMVKAALLRHEAERADAGLAPEIVYRGRDLFALAADAKGVTAATEKLLADAVTAQQLATRAALGDTIRRLPLSALEQVAQLYLLERGWRDIEWVKRVGQSSYATATALGLGGQVLVGVRSAVVDRRGVGELRAGVAAKGLLQGLLLSPNKVDDEARAELQKAGAALHVLAGEALVDAIWDAGIGIRTRAVQVTRIDAGFFDELARSDQGGSGNG